MTLGELNLGVNNSCDAICIHSIRYRETQGIKVYKGVRNEKIRSNLDKIKSVEEQEQGTDRHTKEGQSDG